MLTLSGVNTKIILLLPKAMHHSYHCPMRCLKIIEILLLHFTHIWSIHISRARILQIIKITQPWNITKWYMFSLIYMQLAPTPCRVIFCFKVRLEVG